MDLSIQAGTKYIVGHSDVMIGTVAASERAWKALEQTHGDLGLCVGPNDIYLALRDFRTMSVRLERHMKNALEIAGWLSEREDVTRVLYPARPGAPRHDLWKRDFLGASGLFAIELVRGPDADAKAFLNPQCAGDVRARLFLGRLREPPHLATSQIDSHRDQLGYQGPTDPPPHRP